jgi:glycosyltransferase involved in cell wall biosynthesis
VLEVLSEEKPVIGADALGSSTTFIQNGVKGYLVPEKDANALFEKMKMTINSGYISEKQVWDTFGRIKGHEYQAKKLQEAINFATNLG